MNYLNFPDSRYFLTKVARDALNFKVDLTLDSAAQGETAERSRGTGRPDLLVALLPGRP